MLEEKGIKTPGHKDHWRTTIVESILTNEKYKGEVILQKTYIDDFITHKKVKNKGNEIPLYHVKNSHPFIIPLEEWTMVQTELERRNKLKSTYSGLSVFSNKLICGDCGSFYEQKVWHSTDKYRRVIYQCNHKFSGKNKCKTPTINEELIKKTFTESFAMMNNSSIVNDLEIAIEELDIVSVLDEQIMELVIECDSLNESARRLIDDKKRAIKQDEADKKYDTLVKKHKEVSNKLKKLENERNQKIASIGKIKMTILMLKNNQSVNDEFQIKYWTMLLEKAIVYNDGRIKFCYNCGCENEMQL